MSEQNTLILSSIISVNKLKRKLFNFIVKADMLTKALLSSQFVKLREMLGVRKIIEQV